LKNVVSFQKSNAKPMGYKSTPPISTLDDMAFVTMALLSIMEHWWGDLVAISQILFGLSSHKLSLIHPRKFVFGMDKVPKLSM
jgi:hypothetical protein